MRRQAEMRGAGCAGRVMPSWCSSSSCSLFARVWRGRTRCRPSVVGRCTSTIWMVANASMMARGVRPLARGRARFFQGDEQAVGDEGDEDVGLDPLFALMEDGPDREVVLEFLEGLLDLDQLHVQAPESRGVFGDHVGSQQIAALAAAYPAQPVAPQAE